MKTLYMFFKLKKGKNKMFNSFHQLNASLILLIKPGFINVYKTECL